MRSGKDTLAAYAVKHYGYTRVAFADALKKHADSLFASVENNNKPRELYQWFGQIMRTRDEKVWIRKLEQTIKEYEEVSRGSLKIIITDLRLPNEYEWAIYNNYTIIRVNADKKTRLERIKKAGDICTVEMLEHESERYIDTYPVHFEIDNTGSLQDMYKQFDDVLKTTFYR